MYVLEDTDGLSNDFTNAMNEHIPGPLMRLVSQRITDVAADLVVSTRTAIIYMRCAGCMDVQAVSASVLESIMELGRGKQLYDQLHRAMQAS